jgi:hypothetical protein
MNPNINKILMKLIENQNLCKYLYYNTSDPLSESDIADVTTLLYYKIFPYPTSTEIFKDISGNPIASTVINVLLNNFKLGTTNTKFKNGKLEFIILCHTSLWRLDNSNLRPYCILNEIDEIFSEQRVIGIGKGEFESCSLTWSDVNYSGYRLVYKDYEFL